MGKDDLLSRVGATGAAAERWPATHRKESKAAIPQRRWPFVLFPPFPFPFASPVQSPLIQTRPRPCLHPPFRPPAPRKRSLLAPLRASRNHRDHGSISIDDDSRSIQSCDSPSAAHFCRLWSLTLSRAVAQDGTPVSLPTPALSRLRCVAVAPRLVGRWLNFSPPISRVHRINPIQCLRSIPSRLLSIRPPISPAFP